MTGFGSGRATADGMQITVELQSVNRKQADISINLPKELARLDQTVRDIIAEVVLRGRINATIECTLGKSGGNHLETDLDLARQYLDAFALIEKKLKISAPLDAAALLRAPGVFTIAQKGLNPETARPLIESALRDALGALSRMREREGKNLATDLIQRVKWIATTIKTIQKNHPAVVKRHREALMQRIEAANVQVATDDERLIKELAYFADRSDISEEITRLQSHLKEVLPLLKSSEPVGRKLEFMAQEISRELNTLGSKANDAEISQSIVACKSEMEKIREQIQNIE